MVWARLWSQTTPALLQRSVNLRADGSWASEMDLPIGMQQGVVLVAALAAILSFVWERVSLELTALGLLLFLLIWFQVFPLQDPSGAHLLGPTQLFAGFANPSLIAVLALMVMGQGMVHTGAINALAKGLMTIAKRSKLLGVLSGLIGVYSSSAVLNNTPVVVMFIPVMQDLARRLKIPVGQLMMPLSYAAILGGTLTLVGSSTNLLVASVVNQSMGVRLDIFDMTALAAVMGAVGMVYVVLVLPRLLPERSPSMPMLAGNGRQFIGEITVAPKGRLVGARPVAGQFRELPNVTVRLVLRGHKTILPPLDDVVLQPDDLVIVAATRNALTEALERNAGQILRTLSDPPTPPAASETEPLPSRARERQLAEIVVAPASRMIDQTVDMVGFERRFGILVTGIQRRGRMARNRMRDVRLREGDVLLVAGTRAAIRSLAQNPDVLLGTEAVFDLPEYERAPHAIGIFGGTVALAATGVLPISVAALTGAGAMLVLGCLNIRQAQRAIDRRLFLIVGATLALGAAMEHTGAARSAATVLMETVSGTDPTVNLILIFAVVSVATNLLSNNAVAVLFTPIALGMAQTLEADPMAFAIAVLLGANCSFATPIGYQTNLLVMSPGHYRFADFLRGGLPLMALMALTFALVGPGMLGL